MKTILIVEDDKNQVSILSKALEENYNVKIALDGEKGYEAYCRAKPDIIISDINLPKLNGIELVSKIRQKDNNTRIIMLTSYSEVNYLLDASGLKLTKYLLKPIDIDTLYKTIDIANQESIHFTTISNTFINISSNCYWDISAQEFIYNDLAIKLSLYEKIFLKTIIESHGKTITYDTLLALFWEQDFADTTKNSIKTLVSKLRKKLPINCIENIYGTGYKIISITKE